MASKRPTPKKAPITRAWAPPGAPSPEPPPLKEPTKPREPLPPKPDQNAPETLTPTGAETGAPKPAKAQQGAYLTTAQGVRRPRHRPLAEGRPPWPDPAAGPPPAREDHPLRPRADPGARGARPRRRGPRRVRLQRRGRQGDEGRLPRQGSGDTGVRALLHGARLSRVGRHRARHPRLRDEVLHRGGHVRPRRQQHPGLLHPGRHQVPRHHPRGQAAPRPRDPPGTERARHLLGLRLPAHRGPGPHHLEHVRPRHPGVLPDHGGLRRPHLPPVEPPRRDGPGEVALEAAPGRALPHLGGGAADLRHGPRLPPPRPRRRHRGRRVPAVRPRRSRSSPTPRTRCSRASTCSTRRRSCRRSSPRCRSSAR